MLQVADKYRILGNATEDEAFTLSINGTIDIGPQCFEICVH
jgi:hypothetical protein